MENQTIEQLQKEIDRQKKHIKELQIKIGSYRRLVEGRGYKPEFIREQHDERGRHVKELYLKELPGDLRYKDVLQHIKYEVLPKNYPYQYISCYQSPKYKGWIVKLGKEDNVDMSYLPENTDVDAEELLNKDYEDLFTQLKGFRKRFESIKNLSDDDQYKVSIIIELLTRITDAVEQIEIT